MSANGYKYPPSLMHSEGLQIPLELQQLYILRFYDLDLIYKCHGVALKGSA